MRASVLLALATLGSLLASGLAAGGTVKEGVQDQEASDPAPAHGADKPSSDPLLSNSWRRATGPRSPPTSIGLGTVYIPELNASMVVYNSYYGTYLWVFNWTTEQWDNVSVGTGPVGWAGGGVTYDTHAKRVLIVGGSTPDLRFVQQFWAYDPVNRTWENRTKPTGPSGRTYPVLEYDSQSRLTVLYGGCDQASVGCTGFLDDTWVYDYTADKWTKRSDTSPPGPMTLMASAYDPIADRVVMFGGWGGGAYSYFTWTYDTESNQWTNAFPSAYPPGRAEVEMTYDHASDRIVIYGGWAPASQRYNDTWTYSRDDNRWYEMKPGPGPSARGNAHIVYDRKAERTLLFGGWEVSSYPNDTWIYDLHTAPGPPLNLSATASGASVDLRWSPPVSDGGYSLSSYTVFRGTSPDKLARLARIGNVTAYRDTPPGPGSYYYEVSAGNRFGAGARSVLAAAKTVAPPGPPTGLSAVPGDGSVTLNWTPPSSDGGLPVIGYVVYRGPDAGNYTTNATVGNVTSHSDSGLTNGIRYHYAVSAVNSAGEGPKSADASATPSSAAAPTVTGTAPKDGDSGVPRDAEIVVVFSEPMDPVSTASALSISPAAAGSGSAEGDLLRWRPGAAYEGNTTYTVSIAATAASVAGARLAQPHSFSFTTEPAYENLTGTVTQGDGVLAGARVDAHRAGDDAFAGTGTTDAAGRYTLRLETQRRYYLVVRAPDGSSQRSEVFEHSGSRRVDVHIASRPAPVPPWTPPWALIGLGLVGTLTGLALAGYVGGEALKYALLVIPIWLYSRIHRSRVLDHFVRGQIYGFIIANPGATFTEIARNLGLSNGMVTYHLLTLERTEFIRAQRNGKWKHFFPRDAPATEKGIALSRMQNHILDLLTKEPGLTQSQLASRLGASRQTVHYNVARLGVLGVLRTEGWGPVKRCHLEEGAREMLERKRSAAPVANTTASPRVETQANGGQTPQAPGAPDGPK